MGSTRTTDEKEKGLILAGFQWWHNCLQPHQFGTSSQQGTQLHRWELQAAPAVPAQPFCNWLGEASRGRWTKPFSASQQLLAGVSLSPPNSSASADAEVITREYTEVTTFCYCCMKGVRRMGKNGMVPQSPGFLPILFHSRKTPQAAKQLFHATAKQWEHRMATPTSERESYLQHGPRQLRYHFLWAPCETPTGVEEVFSQLLLCVTSKLISDTSTGKVVLGVILKSLEALLKATLNSKKELRRCHL